MIKYGYVFILYMIADLFKYFIFSIYCCLLSGVENYLNKLVFAICNVTFLTAYQNNFLINKNIFSS